MHVTPLVLTVVIFLAGVTALVLTGTTGLSHLIDDLIALYLVGWGLYAFYSKESRREVQARFVLATVMVAATVLCFEVLAMVRVIDYRQIFRTNYPASALQSPGLEYQPDFLWVRKPHSHLAGTYDRGNIAGFFCLPPQASRTYDVQYDRNGFRNGIDLSEADIVLLGDSYAEAPILKESETLAHHLARLQDAPVANLGMSGYAPQQELHVLQRVALPLRPKVALWMFYEGNDIQDVEAYRTTAAALSSQNPSFVRFWFRSMTRNLLMALLNMRRGCSSKESLEQYKGAFTDRAGSEIPVYFMPREELSFKDDWKVNEAFEVLLQGMRASREHGVRHIVVFVPTKVRILQDLSNVKMAPAFRTWTSDALPKRLQAFIAKEATGAEFLDLTPVLRESAAGGTLPYFEDDTHWNAEGHRLAAEAIHRLLAARTTALR